MAEGKKEEKKAIAVQQLLPVSNPTIRVTKRDSPLRRQAIQPPPPVNPPPVPVPMVDQATQTDKADLQRAK